MAAATGAGTYTLYSEWTTIAWYNYPTVSVPAITRRTAFVIRAADDEIMETYHEEREHEPLPHGWNQ